MKAEVKEKWLKALRSGEYKQAKYGLKSKFEDGSVGYCCLGVLCDIIAKEDERFKWDDEPYKTITPQEHEIKDKASIYGMNHSDTGVLPDAIAEVAELGEIAPTIYQNDAKLGLAYLNDHLCYSFDQIADAIEKGL